MSNSFANCFIYAKMHKQIKTQGNSLQQQKNKHNHQISTVASYRKSIESSFVSNISLVLDEEERKYENASPAAPKNVVGKLQIPTSLL